MRKWGIVVSLVYFAIVAFLLLPAGCLLAGVDFKDLGDAYKEWSIWVVMAMLVLGQAVLLFLSVDISRKRLKPRAHIAVSCIVTALLVALLSIAVVTSLVVATRSDSFSFNSSDGLFDRFLGSYTQLFEFIAAFWLFWGVVFYSFLRNSNQATTRAISWLLKGSVLELLVVLPCHIVVRRRDDCSAPIVTGFGISTGIAIMLLSFGPSVLFLYKKRLDSYARQSSK
jgi:hypothetical protein